MKPVLIMKPVKSSDPRKKSIVAALKRVSKARKITNVFETENAFQGDCFMPETISHEGGFTTKTGKYVKLGVFFVSKEDVVFSEEREETGTVCQDCGKSKPDVENRNCPFASDVHNEIVKIIVCNDCCHQRAMDI